MGGPTAMTADSPSSLSDQPLWTSEYRLNLARSRETDRRPCCENRSPVFSYERSPSIVTKNSEKWLSNNYCREFSRQIAKTWLFSLREIFRKNSEKWPSNCREFSRQNTLPIYFNVICWLCCEDSQAHSAHFNFNSKPVHKTRNKNNTDNTQQQGQTIIWETS